MKRLYSCIFAALLIISLLFATHENGEVHEVFRSSSLQMNMTEGENREKISYYQDGELRYAADKHYATAIKTRGDNCQLEEYFDEHGNPAEQALGHYALLREYDDLGRNYRVTYLDLDGSPVLISLGYSINE